jgi:hypothetical protein
MLRSVQTGVMFLKTIIFVDDTSVIVSNSNFTDFEKVISTFFKTMNAWLSSYVLSLILVKLISCNV